MMRLPFSAGVVAEEITDATRQWKYVPEGGIATITGCVEEASGDLVISGKLDGYPGDDHRRRRVDVILFSFLFFVVLML